MRLTAVAALLTIGVLALGLVLRRSWRDPRRPEEAVIIVGGLYACRGEDGLYRVLKVLAHEDGVVHIRQYVNRFAQRPGKVEVSELTVAMAVDDLKKRRIPVGFAHLPVDENGFLSEEHFFLGKAKVTDEELQAYTEWKRTMSSP